MLFAADDWQYRDPDREPELGSLGPPRVETDRLERLSAVEHRGVFCVLHQGAEHPPVEPEVAEMAADDGQDGGDGQCLERHQRDREHQADRQRSPLRRPYAASRPGTGSRGWVRPVRVHPSEGMTSSAVEVK